MNTLLMFLAPVPLNEKVPPAARTLSPTQARPGRAVEHEPAQVQLRGALLEAVRVIASAAGFIALLAGCWLLLPLMAVLFF